MSHWKIFQMFICVNKKYLGCIPIFELSFVYVQQILGVMWLQSGLFLLMTAKQCCWNGRGCSTESKGKVAMNCKQRMIDGMSICLVIVTRIMKNFSYNLNWDFLLKHMTLLYYKGCLYLYTYLLWTSRSEHILW